MARNPFGRRPKTEPQQPTPKAESQAVSPAPERHKPAAAAAEVAEPVSLARRQTSDGLIADMAAKFTRPSCSLSICPRRPTLDRDQLAVQLRAFLDSEDSVPPWT